jgi:hypothetical protein
MERSFEFLTMLGIKVMVVVNRGPQGVAKRMTGYTGIFHKVKIYHSSRKTVKRNNNSFF